MTSDVKPRDKLERWILTYLGSLDIQKVNDGRAYIDIRTIAKDIPKEIFPEVETQEDIMETLRDMEKRKLIAEWASARYIDEYTFIVTSTGIIQFRKNIQPIVNSVSEQESYEKLIDLTPGDSMIKREFKKLWVKLKDKTEDEIVQILVKGGLNLGTKAAVSFIINLFTHNPGNGP